MSYNDEHDEVMWQGRFITARKKGKWEYVSRARGIRSGRNARQRSRDGV